MVLFGGGMASALRKSYYSQVKEQVENLKDASEEELDKAISEYKSKNLFLRAFARMGPGGPSSLAKYEAANAVKNMDYLGFEEFPMDRNSVFGVMNGLDYLEEKSRYVKSLEEKDESNPLEKEVKNNSEGQGFESSSNSSSLKKDAKCFFGGFLAVSGSPYVVPSVVRDAYEPRDPDRQDCLSSEGTAMASMGNLLSVPVIAGQATMYLENPEYLAVPLATNVASGLYEGGKALYNKFKDKSSKE